MSRFTFLFIVCALLRPSTITAKLLGQTGQVVNVNTKLGQITGVAVDLDVLRHQLYKGKGEAFLGVPFVQPPIGNLRFQVPKPIVGVFSQQPLNATVYKPMCPQLTFGTPILPVDEDCLYLNVIRPAGTQANAKLPVMLWIYGGGFIVGSNLEYSSAEGIITNLVSRGVIVVTINYRLGMMGFFTTFTNDFPSNLGLRDQIEAMKWVKANIDSFGGDPAKVTIFGESSGGCSVSLHTYSPLSRGAFDQAIMESSAVGGSRTNCLSSKDNIGSGSTQNAQIAKDLCGITDAEWQSKSFAKLRSCLLAMPWETLYNRTINQFYIDQMPGPGIDGPGGFMPDRPEVFLSSRRNIPVMLGACADEGITMFSNVSMYTRQAFNDLFLTQARIVDQTGGKPMQSVVKPILEQAYERNNGQPIADNDHLAWIRAVNELVTDSLARSLHLEEAKLWRDINGNRQVYLFNFEYASDSFDSGIPGVKKAVVHTAELGYIFLYEAETALNPSSAADKNMINTMGTMWTNFAKFSNPTPNNSLTTFPFKWQPFTTTNNYLAINNTIAMRINYYQKSDDLFNKLIPLLAKSRQQRTTTI